MTKLRLLPAALIVSFFSPMAYSQVPTSAEIQQIDKRFQQTAPKKFDEPVIEQQVESVGAGEDTNKVLQLNSVEFEGNTVYSSEELSALAAQYTGQKVSFNDLQNIARAITQKYRDDGYILSRAVLAPQKIGGGTVKYNIIEGYISEVNMVGDTKSDLTIIRHFAEKISQKRPVNKRDMERYLLLADDLPGITARSIIRPSSSVPGSSEMIINLEEDKYEYSLQADNFGSRFVGPYELTAVAALNSLFGEFDRTTLRGITAAQTDELLFFDVQHEQQVFSEGTKLKVRYATSESSPGGRLESTDIEGDTKTLSADISYPLIRSRKTNLNLNTGFKKVDSRTNIANTLISNDRIRDITNGFSLEFDDGFRSSNKLDINMVNGVDVFGSTEDGVGRSRSNGNHNFTKFVGELTRLQGITEKFALFAAVTGQYSNKALLASEEISFGGRTYGRGYDSGEISGDQGAAGLAEIRYTSDYQSGYVQNLQFYGFYDAAAVWNKDIFVGEPKKQTLASTGVGVRFNIKGNYSGDLSVGVPLTREVNAEGASGDEPRAFFSIIKRF